MCTDLCLGQRLSQFITQETAEKAGLINIRINEIIENNFNDIQIFKTFDPRINSLEYDSRSVKQGSLFFALCGAHTDGSLFIKDAVKNGAAAVIHQGEITEKEKDIVYIKAKDARFSMSAVSAAFYQHPSRRLRVTGVTGTEGKSTTVFLIFQLLTLLGKKTGFISTVQHCTGGGVLENTEHQTTPEAPVVQRLLREMADNGCEYAVVESSSHGLSAKTNRLGDIDFFCAVLTNVTHEHLEFHGTWEQYRYDKANLFRALEKYPVKEESKMPFGVINADDNSAQYFKKAANAKTFTYSPA